jgi:hypothetical protein
MEPFECYSKRTKRRKIAAKVSKILIDVNNSNVNHQLSVFSSDFPVSGSASNSPGGNSHIAFEDNCVENIELALANEMLDCHESVFGAVENSVISEINFEENGLTNQAIQHSNFDDTDNDETEFSTFDDDLDCLEWEPVQ